MPKKLSDSQEFNSDSDGETEFKKQQIPEPTYKDIVAASETIEGVAHKTQVITSTILNEEMGCKVFLKCENLQRMGAFKFRGAYNAMSNLTPE